MTSKLALLLFLPPFVSLAQPLSLRVGIYEFTDVATREFYLLAPSVLAGYELWSKSHLALELSTGLGFRRVKYDDDHHYLYMVPLMMTMNYNLLNPESKVRPVIGFGAGLMGKADKNKNLDKVHYSLTYGYHIRGALEFPIKDKCTFILDMTFNQLLPPMPEVLDLAGVIVCVGVRIPVGARD